jgi:hypothetical protein
MPALDKTSGAPALIRPGDDESKLRRTGWPQLFAALRPQGLGLVADDAPDSFEHRFATKREARAELPLPSPIQRLLQAVKSLPVPHH